MKAKFSNQRVINLSKYSIQDVYKKMTEDHPAISWYGFE